MSPKRTKLDTLVTSSTYPYLVSVKSSRKCHHFYHVCIKIGYTSNLIVWDRLVLPSEERNAEQVWCWEKENMAYSSLEAC